MGRYYSGDINGKFWFGVQSSDDAEFFGGEQNEPNYIEFYFDNDHIPSIEKGIEDCEKELANYKKSIDTFFKKNGGYNDEMLAKVLNLKEEDVRRLLKWYARLELGKKILKCVKKKGECSFQAEL